MSEKREGVVTFQGNPLTLLGPALKAGDKAPDFTLLKNDLSPVSLSDLQGKTVLISVVPSLDTPVCDVQTKRFNQEAAGLDGVEVLTVSMDLPFAQGRWCGASEATNLTTLSDHRDASFGEAYGVLIDGLRLLMRSIFIVSADGTLSYVQIVPELTDEPDYEAALQALRS